MSEQESFSGNAEDDYTAILGNNYLTSHNVRARFLLYEFGYPYLDIEDKALDALGLSGTENIVDLGAADGNFLRKLRVEHGHLGELIGIEPNTTQFTNEPIWQSIDLTLILRAMERFYGNNEPKADRSLERYLASGLPRLDSNNLELRKGSAENIPLETSSADILCAMFMMYHVPPSKQAAAFNEIKRVLRPGGTFVMTTSGANNKAKHRIFEEQIAAHFNVNAPLHMNTGFTTEKAEIILPDHFKHVYAFKHPDEGHRAEMIIDDPYSVRAYLSSQLSLLDLYSPVPDRNEFIKFMESLIVPELDNAIGKDGAFKDVIERSIFICSSDDVQIHTPGFTKLA